MLASLQLQLAKWLQSCATHPTGKLHSSTANRRVASILKKMFLKRRSPLRPSKALLHQPHHNDQLPFLSRPRFSALPQFRVVDDEQENLTLFIAILYVVDLFGVFPFVTLPGLLAQLGFLGIPLVISVIVVQIYTSFLLSQCWMMAESFEPSIVQKSRYAYAAIADLAYGPYVSLFVRILLNLSIFATAIPNVLVASQNLEMVGERISDDKFSFSFCYWVIIIGLFIGPLMWMGSPKHMRGLAIFSMFVLIVIVILLWFCLFDAAPLGKPFEGVSVDLPPFLTVLNGYSILAFQFDIHPMLLTLQIDMQQKSQVYWAAFSGIMITCTIAIFGSLIAAYKFGSMIAENLLETLPKSVPLYFLLILMALQLCFSATVGSSAMFMQIENYLKISEVFSWKRVVLRSAVVALEVLIALLVPSFDALMDIVGGTIIGPLVFILPPLLYRRISRMERLHQRTAAEAAYGSIPLDLNYEPVDVEMEQLLLRSTPQQRSAQSGACACLRTAWLHTVRCWHRMQCDLSLSMAVLTFGALATVLSTYLNVFRISDLFQSDATCFFNLTRLL